MGTTKRAMGNPELALKPALRSQVPITSSPAAVLSNTRGHGQKQNPVPVGPEEGKEDYCLILFLHFSIHLQVMGIVMFLI